MGKIQVTVIGDIVIEARRKRKHPDCNRWRVPPVNVTEAIWERELVLPYVVRKKFFLERSIAC